MELESLVLTVFYAFKIDEMEKEIKIFFISIYLPSKFELEQGIFSRLIQHFHFLMKLSKLVEIVKLVKKILKTRDLKV